MQIYILLLPTLDLDLKRERGYLVSREEDSTVTQMLGAGLEVLLKSCMEMTLAEEQKGDQKEPFGNLYSVPSAN